MVFLLESRQRWDHDFSCQEDIVKGYSVQSNILQYALLCIRDKNERLLSTFKKKKSVYFKADC